MRPRLVIAALLSLILLTGCLAIGAKFTPLSPNSGSTVLYVYRDAEFVNSAISPEVFVDDRLLGTLTNGGYFAIKLKEGPHTLKLQLSGWTGKAIIEFNGRNSEATFVRVKTVTDSGYRVFKLARVPNEMALKEIVETNNVAIVEF